MEYPKAVMKMSELQEMGFPREWLLSVYRTRNQKIAWKTSAASNGHIIFDTDALEKYRKAQCTGGRG